MWKDSWELRLLVAFFSSTHPCGLRFDPRQGQFPDVVISSAKAFPSSTLYSSKKTLDKA